MKTQESQIGEARGHENRRRSSRNELAGRLILDVVQNQQATLACADALQFADDFREIAFEPQAE
jgi:hypothetical protein